MCFSKEIGNIGLSRSKLNGSQLRATTVCPVSIYNPRQLLKNIKNVQLIILKWFHQHQCFKQIQSWIPWWGFKHWYFTFDEILMAKIWQTQCTCSYTEEESIFRDRRKGCFWAGQNSFSKKKIKNKKQFSKSAHDFWKVLEYDPIILSHQEQKSCFYSETLSVCVSRFDPTQLYDPSRV